MIAAGLKPKPVPDGVPLSQKEFDYLRALPAQDRPGDPSTYLPDDYIEQHLARFNEGGSYLTLTHYLNQFGRDAPGRDDGVFIMPKSEMDAVMSRTGGNVAGVGPSSIQRTGKRSHSNWLLGARLPDGGSKAVVNQFLRGMFTEPSWEVRIENPASEQ